MTIKLIIPTESQEQRALVKWLSLHPLLHRFYCKNTNEGKRTKIQGYNLKLLGLRPGLPDLFIYYPTKTYHGLWLDTKRAKKYTPSEMKQASWVAQLEFFDIVKSVGYEAKFCYGWEDGKQIIEHYLRS